MIEKPVESLYGLGTVVLGLLIYFLTNKGNKNAQQISDTPPATHP
jgi:hypothetical protein